MKVTVFLFCTSILFALVVSFFVFDGYSLLPISEELMPNDDHQKECRKEYSRHEKLRQAYEAWVIEEREILKVNLQIKSMAEPEIIRAVLHMSDAGRRILNGTSRVEKLNKLDNVVIDLVRRMDKADAGIANSKKEIDKWQFEINSLDFYMIFTMNNYYTGLGVDLKQCQRPLSKE